MPIQLDEFAIEKSTYAVVAAFTDENGDAMTPDSVTWTLCNPDGDVINSLEDQSETPASSVTVVLSGDDLKLLDPDNEWEERHLEISAIFDSSLGNDLPLKQSAKFKVVNLKSIS